MIYQNFKRRMQGAKNNNSGIMMVEMAIYFPIIMLSILLFIIISLLITQRVVLDRAVSRAATDAAVFLSGHTHNFEVEDPLWGEPILINTNPYRTVFADAFTPFSPFGSQADFENAVINRAEEYAGWSVLGGFGASPYFHVEYRNHFFSSYITVTATQQINFPLNLSLLGIDWDSFTFRTSASARALNNNSIINDITFGFDALRRITGLDISKLHNAVADLPSTIDKKMSASGMFGNGESDITD